MGKKHLRRRPHVAKKVSNVTGGDAWWYEYMGSIEVFIVVPAGANTVACRIDQSALRDWLRRRDMNASGETGGE